MAYKPIGSYGVIGNMRTAALVAHDGSIDWMCCPRFDSPSVFAAILDDKKGGFFRIAPARDDHSTKQFYWPETNVLVTRFLSVEGVGELTDFMPVGQVQGHPENVLIRHVQVTRGAMRFRMECRPAFDYARQGHDLRVEDKAARFRSKDQGLSLTASLALRAVGPAAECDFELSEGQHAVFVLCPVGADQGCARGMPAEEGKDLLFGTVEYWHRWLSRCTYNGRWREIVHRSALTLKLLTYEPTGAIVAAATTSLPERIGGVRNWDYRYTWIRDAAFTVYALMRIGLLDEATRFMQWAEQRCAELKKDGEFPLQVMYGLDGRHDLTETTLDHLDGYMGSKPVRVGNAAHGQLQLDIYGELLDSVYLYNKHGAPISSDFWRHLRSLANWVADEWRRPDAGIWEVRTGPHQFVYSKLMCWVALDRAERLAEKRSFPSEWEKWRSERDKIYMEILSKGWSREKQTFIQSFGSDHLDASALMMPLVFFMSANDPRMLKTMDALTKRVKEGGLLNDSLIYRYDREAQITKFGEEGSFNMCTFWLVEALTRAGRTDPARLAEARMLFEKMLCYANHLGLYAEETGPRGEALGNFPQAFTHLGLISAAFNLDRALGSGK